MINSSSQTDTDEEAYGIPWSRTMEVMLKDDLNGHVADSPQRIVRNQVHGYYNWTSVIFIEWNELL